MVDSGELSAAIFQKKRVNTEQLLWESGYSLSTWSGLTANWNVISKPSVTFPISLNSLWASSSSKGKYLHDREKEEKRNKETIRFKVIELIDQLVDKRHQKPRDKIILLPGLTNL